MKAVLVCPELHASEGGIPRILRLYARALADDPAHREVVAVVLNDAPPVAAVAAAASEHRVRHRLAARSRGAFARAVLTETGSAARIVVGHLRLLPLVRLATAFRPRPAARYLIAHGIEVDRPLTRAERWALRGLRRVWCVSADTRRRLLARAPQLDPGRCLVLPNAIAPALTPANVRPPPDHPPVVLCVSRLDSREPYKGVDDLVRAFALARRSIDGLRLRVVGDGDDRPRLERLATDLGLTGLAEFTGSVSDAALSAAFADCRLFALPSTREGFGLVFAEALAHGRPIVGVAAGAVPELVTSNNGVLAPPGDVEALAGGLVAALRRDWDWPRIAASAAAYTYPAFRDRVAQAY